MIARDLDSKIYSSSNYNLIAEDNIQKIISANNFPEFLFCFKLNLLILLISTKESMSWKKKPDKSLKNIS